MLGQNIKKYRIAAGLTQQELADKIGRERSVIARYESDSIKMPVNILVTIARALKVTALDLLKPSRLLKSGKP